MTDYSALHYMLGEKTGKQKKKLRSMKIFTLEHEL